MEGKLYTETDSPGQGGYRSALFSSQSLSQVLFCKVAKRFPWGSLEQTERQEQGLTSKEMSVDLPGRGDLTAFWGWNWFQSRSQATDSPIPRQERQGSLWASERGRGAGCVATSTHFDVSALLQVRNSGKFVSEWLGQCLSKVDVSICERGRLLETVLPKQ